jgi:hypothetical protein
MRLWLRALMICFLVHVGMLFSAEFVSYLFGTLMHKVFSWVYAVTNVLLCLFMVSWLIVGNVWYWYLKAPKECEESRS